MEMGSMLMSISSALALFVGMYQPSPNRATERATEIVSPSTMEKVNAYAATKLVCKTGFKAGKTPISLVVGAKKSCYNVKSATAGKKLLTTDLTKSCWTCHSKTGIAPTSLTNSNLRTQGYTLKPASITLAFNAHSAEMAGSVITAKDAKSISAYLQSIK